MTWYSGGHNTKDYAKLREIVVEGKLLDNMPLFADETLDVQDIRVRIAPNLYRTIVQKRSALYRRSPTRTIEIGGEIDEKATEDAKNRLWDVEDGMSAVLKECDFEATLCGLALVLIRFNDKTKKIELQPIPSDRWKYKREEKADRVPFGEDITQPSHVRVFYNDRVETYSDKEIEIEYPLSDKPNVKSEHGYSVLPAVVLPNALTFSTVSAPPSGGYDQLENIINIQHLFERLAWFGALAGDIIIAEDGTLNLVRSQIHAIQQNPLDVDIKGPQSDITGVMNVIQTFLDAVSLSMDVPRRHVSIRITAETISAAVIAASEQQLNQALKERHTVARRWERTILRRASQMLVDIGEEPLPTEGLKIEFVENPIPLTYPELESRAKTLNEIGLADKNTLAQQLLPHEEKRKNEEMVRKAQEEKDRDTQRDAAVAGHLQDTTQAGIEAAENTRSLENAISEPEQ